MSQFRAERVKAAIQTIRGFYRRGRNLPARLPGDRRRKETYGCFTYYSRTYSCWYYWYAPPRRTIAPMNHIARILLACACPAVLPPLGMFARIWAELQTTFSRSGRGFAA
ncbi:MAG TPA: hypothetical protein VMS17_07530 [Gemmataceae bacterium]|nr:hypothetical protein [Gemmataceae bacterium]